MAMAATPAEGGRIAFVGGTQDAWTRERDLLTAEGFHCRWLGATPDALAGMRADIVVMDGDDAGFAACLGAVDGAAGRAPWILVLATSGEEGDVEAALAGGADDYLTRPIGGALLLARIRTALRSRGVAPDPEGLSIAGPYRIDRRRRVVEHDGQTVALTAREFDLACLLFANIGRPLSRAHVLETIWGYRADASTRTLDTHISRVRTKLGLVAENGAVLSSHYGYGYQLDLCGR